MKHQFGIVELEPMIDLFVITDALKSDYGMDYRDMAGKYSDKAKKEKEALLDKWLSDNGYEGMSYVLDKPKDSAVDWPKDSYEMLLRTEINTKKLDAGFDRMLDNLYPYQDVWHYLLDHDFAEFNRGGSNILYLEDYESDPDYVKTFRKTVLKIVEGHPAFDADELTLNCYVDW